MKNRGLQRKRKLKINNVTSKKLIEKCQEMIRTPGESGKEKQVACVLKKIMEEKHYDQVWIDDWGNVIGKIAGPGTFNLLLQGHMDTVGVEKKSCWQYPPFGGVIRNGNLYRRGSSDMKSALTAMVIAGAEFVSRKEKLKGNLFVAGVVHEEIFEGIAQGRVLDQVNPNLVIIGESSGLKLCTGQKGRAEIKIITYGKSAHSANPDEGINAVKNMARLLNALESIDLPSDDSMGKAILELTDIHSSPYPGRSVIPAQCMATFDRRLLPGEKEEDVIAPINHEIEKISREDHHFKAEIRIIEAQGQCYTGKTFSAKRFFPGWIFNDKETFIQKALKALKDKGFSDQVSHYAFCTDGSQSAGIRKIPTIGFGPSQEKLAHICDEHIEISQITAAYQAYTAFIEAFLMENK